MPTNIFISYRKDDSKWNTQLLYDRLSQYFPKKNLFKDFNTIKAGDDYRKSISMALNKCHVLLVIIGKSWATIKDENGVERLQNPEDLVRIEIETALNRNIRVIPVLFDNITMPAKSLLPEGLWPLSLRQSISVNETNFDYDIKHLAEAIRNKHIEDTGGKINFAKILQYRIILTVVLFTLLAALITGVAGLKLLGFQYIMIAVVISLIVSLIISSLLKNRIHAKAASGLKIACVVFFLLSIAAIGYHIYYFQQHTFIYNGFRGQSSYYIKGVGYTSLGDSLKRMHENMTDADVLKKFLGGPGQSSRLWIVESIIKAKFIILFSYAAVILFLSLCVSTIMELLSIKYKPT